MPPLRAAGFFAKMRYTVYMRKILFVWVVAAVVCFTACEEQYYSLPESELPVEYIAFDRAEYDASGDSITISLYFDGPFEYDAVYQYYNMEYSNMGGTFSMKPYLKKSGLSLVSSWLDSDPKRIVMRLSEGSTPPDTLRFNTAEPLYFGSRKFTVWRNPVIIAKGFIKTKERDVDVLP